MSIYKQVLGEKFKELHPMLQKRYELEGNVSYTATGVMKTIHGGPRMLYPLFFMGTRRKLLFPEHGKNIPFQIVNTPLIAKNGEQQVHWERIFYFEKKKRYFNALMSFDQEKKVIKDYFGEPSIFYSDLVLDVTDTGGLIIKSSRQRLVLGRLEIPLPRLFQGIATVREEFDPKESIYIIYVTVINPIVGRLFAYEGTFTHDDIT
ncbi:DUF4166 domain-containing protein [Ornithinibacillus sp. L9]|uniref:DUF4166 domain-containing protein n=1 Tax=Ornithinibacillus caprae TaxID=2678566 RepID=A0A6N8FM91_9BACI|nr:DUF4166 domain-containing protein [Ornithinibacillus caprae]MUK90291.1 DUF4166 domain-containing protein [Ornithinibacillus caprae]